MNIEQWITQLEEAYKSAGGQLSSPKRLSLLKIFSGTEEQIAIFEDAEEKMLRFFFRKVINGDTFGSVSRIKEIMGKSLEDNYKLKSGSFFNLAKTYWTYKIELFDLFPYPNPPDHTVLSKVLTKVEEEIAEVFFPTPLPPLAKDRLTAPRVIIQEKVLKLFAPEIDVQKFMADNPIIKAEAARRGCLGTIFLMILIPVGFLVMFLIIRTSC